MRKISAIVSMTLCMGMSLSACQFAGAPVFDKNTEHKVLFGQPTVTDEPLAVTVKKALRAYPTTAGVVIDVGLQSAGIVKLVGFVSTDQVREDAVLVARKVEGVESVVNALYVQ